MDQQTTNYNHVCGDSGREREERKWKYMKGVEGKKREGKMGVEKYFLGYSKGGEGDDYISLRL